MSRFVLACYGTVGDIDPMLALARALLDQGDEVVFFGNPYLSPGMSGPGLTSSLPVRRSIRTSS